MTLPAINVTIEDRSFALPTLKTGRSGYSVILGDRGPHNRVVEVNSLAQFHRLFGKPDLERTGQGHYMADKFLQHSSRLFVVRPAIIDDTILSNNSIISNMTFSAPTFAHNTITTTAETYSLALDSNIMTASTTTAGIAVGDWFSISTDPTYTHSRQIISIVGTVITLDAPFTGANIASTTISTYVPTSITTILSAKDTNSFGSTATNAGEMFHMHAVGVGEYYNSIVVRGVRNKALEKMYLNPDASIKYPNMFMDLYVYYQNSDGTMSLIEGPWTVSLMNKADGSVVRDLSTGLEMFLPTVVNSKSDFIRVVATDGMSRYDSVVDPDAPALREFTQMQFAAGVVSGTSTVGLNGVGFRSGSDGIQYDSQGRLNITGKIAGITKQAFNGTLTSTDGTIELIVQSVYPWYEFDYILSGGYSATIQAGAVTLADSRSDAMVIADTGHNSQSANEDITARLNDVGWNTYNAMLYTQYREIFDMYTGKQIYITPAYHAIERHLVIDARDWIAEPVAGIEKGAIQEPITLSYRPSLIKLNDLIDGEMNPVIVEPQGKYILHQLTTWKRLSIMKRGHAVKFIHFIKKEIPKLLKDILQHKATPFWVGMVDRRINGFMSPFVVGASASDRLAAMTSFSVSSNFDEARSEIQVALIVRPIRSIEAINVSIIVV